MNDSTVLLASSNDLDKQQASVITSEGTYPREITSVGRTFIMQHYRAYGGPEPPPIDHQGIDDAFLEKASVTWYFHKGSWRKFPGAD